MHCFEDANYFKNKYLSNSNNTVGVASAAATTASKDKNKEADTSTSNLNTTTTSISDYVKENIMISALLKTGKFTEKEAIEFTTKIWHGENEKTTATGNEVARVKSRQTGSEDTASIKNLGDKESSNANKPEDYNDLSQLVHDIKNKDVDYDKITLIDFQN